MERTFISWNITNWITVLLMVYLGWAIFAFVSQAWRNWMKRAAMVALFVMPAVAGGAGYA